MIVMKQTFIPVVLGGSRGAYGIGRSLYEEYKIKVHVFCSRIIGPVADVPFFEYHVLPDIKEEKVLFDEVNKLENETPDIPKIIFGSDDLYAEFVIVNKERFPKNWIVPYVDENVFKRATDKQYFYEACEKLNVPYPKTKISAEFEAELPFEFPIVMKPITSQNYQDLHFEGKKKVYILENQEEYRQSFEAMRKGGYQGEVALQEYIPGDDSTQAVVTAYRSIQDGKVKLISFGQILLEDHTPSGIGNHLAILSREEESVYENVRKLVEEFGFDAFSNYDLKYDARDGQYKFFELNGRLGVSHYYVCAAGENVAAYYIKDWLTKEPIEPTIVKNEALFNVVPKRLLLKYIKDPILKDKIKGFYKTGKVSNPLDCNDGVTLKRRMYIESAKLNFFKKFKQHPPEEA